MANHSATGLAGIRVRQARQKRSWTARELAERCAKAGAPQITATVVTNLETRRRNSRQVAVDEWLVLAHVLEVPPLQLLLPLEAGEELEVVPGTDMDALEAVRWIGGPAEPPGLQNLLSPVPGSTANLLRTTNSDDVLAMLRQADYLLQYIAARDRDQTAMHVRSTPRMPVLADRLMHVTARLEVLGYPVPLSQVGEILARRGLPSTLAQWREQAAADSAGYGYDDGEA